MVEIGLKDQEIRMIQSLLKGPSTISELASHLGISRSWCSRVVSHLVLMGLLRSEQHGRRSNVELNHGPIGNALSILLTEDPMLDLLSVLAGRGLSLLPYLIPPGSTVKHIVQRTGLSSRTIRPYLKRWRELGLVQVRKRVYLLNNLHPYLIQFIKKFNEERISRVVKEIAPDANSLWSGQDDGLISSLKPIKNSLLMEAGPTALTHLGENIIFSHSYYLYSPVKQKVSREEALVQALIIDRIEPRLKRLIIKDLKAGIVDRMRLLSFSREYGIEEVLKEVLANVPEKSA